jgi:hypothetical protein
MDENGCSALSEAIEITWTQLSSTVELKGIEIFPNPTDGMINIRKSNEELVNMEIYSGLGRLIRMEKLFKKVTQFDLSDLQKGLYFIRLYNPNQTKESKIIVN